MTDASNVISSAERKIIHVDMDAFYASIEQRDNPAIRYVPVIVGTASGNRGVVTTASYKARKFGISSGMPTFEAKKMCPPDSKAVFLTARMEVYEAESEKIKKIFLDYTDLVQTVALDEAYLDVTVNKKNISLAMVIAKEIKKRIYSETGLTSSAGVSHNMFLAKVASGLNKPDGLTEITRRLAVDYLYSLPIGEFLGVGEKTVPRFHEMDVFTGEDLTKLAKVGLIKEFGKTGELLYDLVRGTDERKVTPNGPPKSLAKETTLQQDTSDTSTMLKVLWGLASQLEILLKEKQLSGRTVTLKVRYSDFKEITRSKTLDDPVGSGKDIIDTTIELLAGPSLSGKQVRKLGISISGFPKQKTDENDQTGGAMA